MEHNNRSQGDSAFTARGVPWELVLIIENLESKQAYAIERHIKKMKSSIYIQNLVLYPEIIERLKAKYLVRPR